MTLPRWKRQLPNTLTLARLAMALALVALLALAPDLAGRTGVQPALLAATILFVLAAATDALDGYLARKWNAVSVFGRITDPFADKILVLGTAVMLATPTFRITTDTESAMAAGFTGWMVVFILGRELLVTTIRGVFESKGVDFSASASGKAKMVIQSVASPGCLLAAAVWASDRPNWAGWAVNAAAWGTTLITAASAVPYISRAAKASTNQHTQDTP
ncbi:MAG: CDP-diacylglycerol--glycerol-3-phosphate 3-phosphatidyltransferase [Phycisphaerales bacterium]